MSREDHRKHDAELERSRALQAEGEKKAGLIKEAILAVFTLIAFLSAFVIEDLRFVFAFLSVAWIAVLLFCYRLQEVGRKWQWMTAVCLTVVFGVVGIRIRHNHLEKERENVRANLRFKATMASNLRDSVVTVNNGGSIPVRYRFLCKIAMLVPVGGQGFIKNSTFIDHVRSGVLTAGSDAQADDCLSNISTPVENLACVDIKVRFFYSLEDQPTEEQEEDHGFIALRRGNKFEWADRGARQEVSDCERFLTRKFVSPDDQLRDEARAIKAQSEHLVETIGLNPEKKAAAALSAEILDFGESIKGSKPKEPDMEKDGFMAAPNYQKEFLEWGKNKAEVFHSTFDSRIIHTADIVRKAGTNPDNATINCSIISPGYPPTVSQTQRCSAAILQLARTMPNH